MDVVLGESGDNDDATNNDEDQLWGTRRARAEHNAKTTIRTEQTSIAAINMMYTRLL